MLSLTFEFVALQMELNECHVCATCVRIKRYGNRGSQNAYYFAFKKFTIMFVSLCVFV